MSSPAPGGGGPSRAARPAAVVASSAGPGQVGGLTAAIVDLVGVLSDTDWTWIARTDEAGSGAAEVEEWHRASTRQASGARLVVAEPRRGVRRLLPLAARLRYRQATNRGARGLTRASWVRPVSRAMPPTPSVVLWVGTGWELFGFPVLAAARRSGAPVVACPFLHPGTWGDAPLDASLYRLADACVAQTGGEGDALVALGVPRERVHVIGLGPSTDGSGDARRFRALHGLGDRLVVLHVGRRAPTKGLEELALGVDRLRAAGRDVVLVTLGPGHGERRTSADGGRLDLGLCDEAEKADAYAAADVVCLPSTAESFGLVVVEAWLNGKPVVVGPAPALAEIVDDGVDGIVVEQTPESIAAAVGRLLDDEDLRRSMGRAGRQKQSERYSWERIGERYRAVFTAARAVDDRRRSVGRG